MNEFDLHSHKDWQVGQAEPNGFKSITAFYPQETSTSNGKIYQNLFLFVYSLDQTEVMS
jgi:hypothetical protein